ncbi:hypothetical protein BDZ91DRAFT_746796 [Kalaharituber pfeilii]|nr:hypothetical protein BDZ91DRAFT_746796 [Kalaharituber pfeilii]
MVPHKDNPKKVATGGNWAGQGYWVPYVVALYYARNWSFEYRYLFVAIWGNDFPSTCKSPGDEGYRKNTLPSRVIAAARRESEYFFQKAVGQFKGVGRVTRKKNGRNAVDRTGNDSQPSPFLPVQRQSLTQESLQDEAPEANPTQWKFRRGIAHTLPHADGSTNALPLPAAPAFYGPVREPRSLRFSDPWTEQSQPAPVEPLKDLPSDKKGTDRTIARTRRDIPVHSSKRGKRKRGIEVYATSTARKRHGLDREAQGEKTNYGVQGWKHTHGAGKDWRAQEQEAAETLLELGRAAVTA